MSAAGPRRRAQRQSHIPEFASIQEEATFWDSHDSTEFEDEFVPVNLVVEAQLSEHVTIRLDDACFKKLRERAKEEGLNVEALAHRWVLERLDTGSAS